MGLGRAWPPVIRCQLVDYPACWNEGIDQSHMRKAAMVVLVVIASLPLLIGYWLFIPIVAAVLIAIPIYLEKPVSQLAQKATKITKMIAVGLAVLVALGFIFWSPSKPQRSSAASRLNTLVSRLPGSTTIAGLNMGLLEADMLSLRSALQRQRQQVSVIGGGLSLRDVAKAEYDSQVPGSRDEKLQDSLSKFADAFRPRPDFRPENPDQLENHLNKAAEAIDALENTANDSKFADTQQIRRFIEGIPDALRSFELDPLYYAVTDLQDRLNSSLKVEMGIESLFTVTYDRKNDTLISEQDNLLKLSNNRASYVNVTGFFSSADGRLGPGLTEEVFIQEEASAEQKISSKEPVYRLRMSSGSIRIGKRVRMSNASQPISPGKLPLQFTAVQINWPLPSKHAVTLGIQEHGNPNITWPFVVSIDNSPDAALSRIVVPRYSFYYSDPGIDKVTTTATSDELTPGSVGKLSRLFPGSRETIRIELAPSYLSNSPSQKFKEYLVTENLLAGSIIWLITVIGLGALKGKS